MQKTYLIKGGYPKYNKNSENSTRKSDFKSEPKTFTDTSLKKIYR